MVGRKYTDIPLPEGMVECWLATCSIGFQFILGLMLGSNKSEMFVNAENEQPLKLALA